ncbi:MAG: DUF2147 domain-containing protein [Saprospiraceae bacterium]
MQNKTGLLIIFFFAAIAVLSAQSPVGTWKTIDDNTGEAKSYVQIYERNGKLYGKVTDLLLKPDDTVCKNCEGDKHNKPVVGMVIVESLAPYKDYWKNGTILDPESGSTYGCSIWFENGNKDELFVRGKHWTGIYRTQKWYRVKGGG